jgi:uncharacterized protein (TIRG00374 family)
VFSENTEPNRLLLRQRLLPWFNVFLTVGLVIAGLWYLSTRVSLQEIGSALAGASPGFVLLAVLIMVITIFLKGWRWQLMFASEQPTLHFSPAFWSTALGQYVNLVVPFLRLGEIARLYAVNQETGISAVRAAGTLVVEKTLDLIFFGLTIAFILPFVILPDYVNDQESIILLVPVLLLILLYALSFQTEFVIRIWRIIVRPLPDRVENWFLRIAVSGLEGLAALRNPRLSLLLLASSLVIALLSVLLPYSLFPAFDIPLTLLDAALIHIVVSVAIAPPSTPAKIGVFNGAAALMLYQFGLKNEAIIFGYAILFYLVVIIPQIIMGIIAASRSKWRWQSMATLVTPDTPAP